MAVSSIPLRIYSPAQVVVLSLSMYLLLYLAAPLDFLPVGDLRARLVFAGFVLCLGAGMLLGFRRFRSVVVALPVDPDHLNRLKWTMALIGGVGLLFRGYDRLFLRGAEIISMDFVVNREMIVQGGGREVVSLFGAMLVPMLILLPIPILALRRLGRRNLVNHVLLVFSSSLPLFDLAVQGSRSSLAVYLGVLAVAGLSIGAVRINLRVMAMSIIGLFAITWAGGFIFWIRTTQMGLDPVESMYASAYSFFAPVNDPALAILRTEGNEGIGGLLYIYIHFSQYFLHGMREFFYLVDNFSGQHTWGLQTAYVPIKLVWLALGQEGLEDIILRNAVRPGVFTTLFGPIFYDFGIWGGALVCVLFGYAAGELCRRLRRGAHHYLALYAVTIGLLPFTFAVNLFTGGTGQYLLINAVFLTFWLSRSRKAL